MSHDVYFSIVIPTYDRPNALRTAIVAAAGQTYDLRRFEVIVVDNHVSQSARSVVDELKYSNVRYLHQPRSGAHHARNMAAEVAHGRYLVLQDDDCEATPALLANYEEALSAVGASVAGGPIQIKWDTTPAPWIRGYEVLMGKIDLGDQILPLPDDGQVNGGNMVVERRLFLEMGGMKPDQVGRLVAGSGDVGLCNQCREMGIPIWWVPGAVMYHWQQSAVNGKMSDLLRRTFNNGIWRAYEDAGVRQRGEQRVNHWWTSRVRIVRRREIYHLRQATRGRSRRTWRDLLLDLAEDAGYAAFCVGLIRGEESESAEPTAAGETSWR